MKKERKKNRRKRARDDSQGPRVAKQQRLHSNNHHQHISVNCNDNDSLHPTSDHSSSSGFDRETDDSSDTNLTIELTPSSVTMETTKPSEVQPKQKVPKKTGGFRDLLTQLRGNSSMIVREKL